MPVWNAGYWREGGGNFVGDCGEKNLAEFGGAKGDTQGGEALWMICEGGKGILSAKTIEDGRGCGEV